ncbi:ImmA/IrrE family metallo-endopeptidase [Glutamicibacter sp.]|uniref:ImmA/IrrE family metallo-endopeptidase n=1 Tax=Glutamicibacter sp. TaxID=1931995 RepID=UPI0028BF4709|nr:ImmA/IrrE family metallo-endopeptidase [Glutamicibacter sp.]
MLEPTRITLAREHAGLSIIALARLLALAPETIADYELHGAPQALAAELASATGFLPGFFSLAPASAIEARRIFYRTPRRLGGVQKSSAAALARCGVELYSLITGCFTLPDTQVPDYTGLDAHQAADRLRLDWNLGCGPIPDLLYVLESHGVRVLSGPVTLSFWEDGQGFIFLSPGDEAGSRYRLAHELAHLLLHSALEEGEGCAAEHEADVFAASLLLPELSLQLRVGASLRLGQLLDLQTMFGVPAAVILGRTREAQLIDEQGYCRLMQELALEPPGPVVRATSRVFSIVFPALRVENHLGTTRIAHRLGLNAQLLHELTFGQAFVLLAGGGSNARTHLHAVR